MAVHSFIHSAPTLPGRSLVPSPVNTEVVPTLRVIVRQEAVGDSTSLAVLGWEGRPYSQPLGQVWALRGGELGRVLGGVGRQSRQKEQQEPRLRGETETWWRGFCDCCFCLLDEAGFGGCGGRQEGEETCPELEKQWPGSLGAGSCLCLTSLLPDKEWGHTFQPEASLGPSLGPGASSLDCPFLLGWEEGCPSPRPPHQSLPSLAAPAAATPTAL